MGPGIVVNVIMKDYSGRPRPMYVTEFGGKDQFLPWWDMRGPCTKNCSFVAGEPSGAFWTMAPAAVAPPHWRAAAYGAALVFGAAVGVLRMSAGGHFFTDVVFGGVVIFLVIWLVHGLLYRWRATRLTDAGIERVLERIGTPGYDARDAHRRAHPRHRAEELSMIPKSGNRFRKIMLEHAGRFM